MKYNVTHTHYRDIYGNLLWHEPMTFKRLHAVGEEIVEDFKLYIVRRVAVATTVQHVNLEPVHDRRGDKHNDKSNRPE
jgi:hypothetical protein